MSVTRIRFILTEYRVVDFNKILSIKCVKYGIIVKSDLDSSLQGYLEFTSSKRLSTLQRINAYIKWLKCDSDALDHISDCKSIGKWLEFNENNYEQFLIKDGVEIEEKEIPQYIYKFSVKSSSVELYNFIYFLNEISKKWVFQQELTLRDLNKTVYNGETISILYYIGILSLKTKKRKSTIENCFSKIIPEDLDFSVFPNNIIGNISWIDRYEVKIGNNFITGPWSSEFFENGNYISFNNNDKSLKMVLNNLKNWQYTILELIKKEEKDENINIILSEDKNNNTIDLERTCKNERVATFIEIVENYKEIYEKVIIQPKIGNYIIQIPDYITDIELKKILKVICKIKRGSVDYNHLNLYLGPVNIWIYMDFKPEFDNIYGMPYVLWKIVNSELVKSD